MNLEHKIRQIAKYKTSDSADVLSAKMREIRAIESEMKRTTIEPGARIAINECTDWLQREITLRLIRRRGEWWY